MAQKFPRLKDGDELEPWHINIIFQELERWRKITASGLIGIDYADSASPPVVVDYRDDDGLLRAWFPTGIGAGTLGSPASKADVVLCVRSGDGWTTTGGTTITVFNCDTTAISGAKAGWVVARSDASYELVVADC